MSRSHADDRAVRKPEKHRQARISMHGLMPCLFLILAAVSPTACKTNATKLHILGLFSSAEPWRGVQAILPATRLAFQDVNANPAVLPDYEIVLVPRESECDGGKATDEMYRQLYDVNITTIMIIGPGCSIATEPTAQASHHWNLIQISYGAASPKLSSRELFPRFFRLVQPESMLNVVKLAMFRKFNWKKVAIIHGSDPLFSLTAADFQLEAEKEGLEIIAAESFIGNPTTQVENIKNSGARIIVAGFYSNTGRKVFCAAYHQKLFGAKYVWILPGWLDWEWWRVPDDTIDCSPAQMDDVTNNYFVMYINGLPADSLRSPSLSGMTSSEFLDRFNAAAGTDMPESLVGYPEKSFAYDTVWTAALALDAARQHLSQLEPPRSLEDFAYDSATVQVLFDVISNLSFEGISGPVKFTSTGDRLGLILIRQLQDGRDVKVGVFDPTLGSGGDIIWDGYDPIRWPDGAPPIDFTIELDDHQTIHPAVFTACTAFALIGIAIASCFLAFNIRFRKLRVIKMSTPAINNVMLMGGILSYLTIIFVGVDTAIVPTETFVMMCTVKTWSLSIGFSLAFGSMFSKTWRVHKIFTNKTTVKKVVRDQRLFGWVACLVFLDLLILIPKEIVDPVYAAELRGPKVVSSENDDIVYTPVRLMCESRHQTYWTGAFYVIDGLLLIFGAFLAWETRHVSIPALNDSKYIGVCIYNVLILSFVGVAVSFVLEDPNAECILVSALVWLATTLTLCVVFVPKIKGRNDIRPVQSELVTNMKSGSQLHQTKNLTDKQNQIQQLHLEIDRLKRNCTCSGLEETAVPGFILVAPGTGFSVGAEEQNETGHTSSDDR